MTAASSKKVNPDVFMANKGCGKSQTGRRMNLSLPINSICQADYKGSGRGN